MFGVLKIGKLGASMKRAGFNPRTLFSASEPGAWYDPSDMSTLFQDAAGTTPVTAVGQPVGLRLDKSKGLALGPEKFSDASVTFNAPSSRVSPGVYRIYSSDGSYSQIACGGATVDKFYDVSFTIDSIANAGGGITVDWTGSPAFKTTGVKRLRIRATSTSFSIKRAVTACDYQVSNISVKEIAGNHAYQSSLLSRATLQLVNGCYGLLYDGIDDFYVTPSINFTGTDKVTVWAGVRKLSDAARAMLLEFGSMNGVFRVEAPNTGGQPEYIFTSRGTSNGDALYRNAAVDAPNTSVLTGIGSISGDSAILRLNGSQVASSSADQGTGEYGNYPLYIGRRSGTLLPFNGYEFGIIVRGAQTSDTDIAATERWLAQKTGVTL